MKTPLDSIKIAMRVLGISAISFSLIANGEKESVLEQQTRVLSSTRDDISNLSLNQPAQGKRLSRNASFVDFDDLLADLHTDFETLGIELDNLTNLANLNLPEGFLPIDLADLDALLADARALIENAIAILDPNDPVEADVIAALNNAKTALLDVITNLQKDFTKHPLAVFLLRIEGKPLSCPAPPTGAAFF